MFNERPWLAGGTGILLAGGVLAFTAAAGGGGAGGLDLALRAAHVLAAIVWGGLIVFVNFVQLEALRIAAHEDRAAIVREIVPRTGRAFTAAAHATLVTGLVLLVPVGSSVFSRPVLLAAVVGGSAMWAIVQFVLRPGIARITGATVASDEDKARARVSIAFWARVNLVLVTPVTVLMLVAAHGGL